MNQTKKRLQIIKLAISITDIETIQLQILKLTPLKTDKKIQEIISGLQIENYAQTQALITTYIEAPMDEILQRTFQADKDYDHDIIEEFDLFVTTPQKPKENEKEMIDFDALLNIDADDILSDNITLDISHTPQDTFFDKSAKTNIDTKTIPKDTFFDTEESPLVQQQQEEVAIEKEESHKKTIEEEPPAPEEPPVPTEKSIPSHYKAISYIDQKFKNMHKQYPPVHESDEEFTSVKVWLSQISNNGCSEKEVEEKIEHISKLTEANKLAEAAQLLLISGATRSQFAQFILSRELYKGKILQKNLSEAFTLISRLALDDNYPEAICDLGQFYERGIGVDKDMKKAEELYKDAMDLGIKRAIDHYKRVRKQNNSFFSAFKKLKSE